MDVKPHQATADTPVVLATGMSRKSKKSTKTTESADHPVRKRVKSNSKIQGHENLEINQDNLGEKTGPKKRRIYAKLAELPAMPLDILFEIFSHLMPLDLLRLARTTKDFRKLLMGRSSISLWKDVLRNTPGLPECPPWMSEPAWVNLVFYPHCHFCWTRTPNIEWRFRARICGKCSKECLGEFSFQYIFTNAPHSVNLESVLPCRISKQHKKAYLMTDLLKLNEEYNAIEGDEARGAYIHSRKQKVRDIISHSTSCESWARSQNHDRELELRQLREERKVAIIGKLEDLGWAQDIAGIRYPDSLVKHRLVDRPQHLTEKIWSHIKDPILEYMAQMRQKRLQRELNALILIRKGVAIEVLRALKKAKFLEGNQVMPEPPDFCDFEPVKEIINKPADVDVVCSTFDPILPLLPGIISSWRYKMDGAMADVVKRFIFSKGQPVPEDYLNPEYPRRSNSANVKLSDEQALQKVKGAATAFVCKKCSPEDDSYDSWSCYTPPPRQPTQLFFYPQVLTHHCLTRQSTGLLEDYEVFQDPSRSLGSYGLQERTRWQARVAVDTYASGIAEAVIRYIGLDPSTATSNDVDHLDDRFICRLCSKKSPIQDVANGSEHFLYDWRSLVAHLAYCFHSTIASDLEKNLLRFKPNQQSDEVKDAEKTHRINTIKEWACFHCLDTPKEKALSTLAAVKQHIMASHSIENPVLNEDYFKSFNSADITSSLFQHALKVRFANGNLSVAQEDHESEIVDENDFYLYDSDNY